MKRILSILLLIALACGTALGGVIPDGFLRPESTDVDNIGFQPDTLRMPDAEQLLWLGNNTSNLPPYKQALWVAMTASDTSVHYVPGWFWTNVPRMRANLVHALAAEIYYEAPITDTGFNNIVVQEISMNSPGNMLLDGSNGVYGLIINMKPIIDVDDTGSIHASRVTGLYVDLLDVTAGEQSDSAADIDTVRGIWIPSIDAPNDSLGTIKWSIDAKNTAIFRDTVYVLDRLGIGTDSITNAESSNPQFVIEADDPRFMLNAKAGSAEIWFDSALSRKWMIKSEQDSSLFIIRRGTTDNPFTIRKSDGAITFNEVYRFPTSDGSANNLLKTDGSGQLAFSDTAHVNNVIGTNRIVQINGWKGDADATMYFDTTVVTAGKTGAWIVTDTAGVPDTLNNLNRFLVASGTSDSIGYDTNGGAIDGYLYPTYLREGANVTFTIAGEDTLTIAASAGSGLDTTEVLQIITDNPISSAQIADSAITNADVSATAGIEGSKLADNSIDQEELANTLDFTGNVITFDAGEITYGEIAFSNNIVAGDIATQAVGALEIENNSIAQGDIATGGVASDEIADGTVDSVDLAKVYVAADGGTPLTADWAAGDHNITGLEKVEADTLQAASFILNVAGVDYYYDSTSAGGSGYTLTVDPTDSTIGWAEGGAGKVASISFDTTDNGTPDLITTDSLAIRAGAYIDFSWLNSGNERELTISSSDATTGDTTSANPFRVVINNARQMSLWEDSAFFDAAQIYKGVSHADSVLVTKGYAQSLSGSGEVNTLADTGTFNGTEGFGLAGGKTGVALKVKGLIAGSNITITADGDSAFSIASTGGGSGTTDTTFVNTTAGGGAPTDSIVNDPYLAQGQNINLTVAGDTVTIAAVDSVTHALIADSAKKVDTTGVVWNEATHAAVADSASKVDTTGVVWNEASHAAVADSSSKVDTTGIVWNEAAHAVLADSATAIADGAVSGSDKIAAHIIDTSDLNVLAVGADGKVLTTTSGQFSWADDANTQNPVTVYKDSFYVKHLSTMAGLGVDGFKYKGDTIFIDTADAGAGGGSEDSLTVNVSGVEYSIMSDYIKLKAGSGVTFTRADSTAFDDISFSVDTTALPLEKYAASADSATWNQAYDSVIAWADQPNQHLPLAGGRMTGYTGDFVIDSAKAGDTRSLTRLGFYDTAEVVHYIDYDAVDNRYEIDGPAIFNGDVVALAGKFTSAAGNSEQWELAYDSTLAWDNGVLLWASGIQALTADWAAGDFEVTGLNVVESDTFSVDPGGLATVLWEDGGGNLSFKDAVTGTKTLAELAAGGADGDSMILNAGTALTGTVHFVQGTGMTLVHGNGAGNDSITFNSTGGSPWSESEAAGDTTMRWVDGGSDTLITFDKTTSTNVKISTGDLDNAFTLHIEGEAGTTIGDTATDAAATVFMADTIRAEAANTLLIGTPNIPIKQINMNDFDLYTGGDNGGAYDSTDVPTNGQVLSWATGGIINWQDDDGAANSLANLFPFFHRDYFDTAADAGGDSIFVILSDSATNIEDGSVTGGTAGSGVKIAATTITDANINAGAAIAYSKLNHPDADHTSLQTTAIHNTDNDTSNANVRLHIRDTVGVSGMNLTAPVINTSIDLPANAVNTATEISADIITGTQIIDDLATGIDTITVTNLVEADTIYAEHVVANTNATLASPTITGTVDAGAATTFEIANSNDPSAAAVGEIEADANDDGLEVWLPDQSDAGLLMFTDAFTATIVLPDSVQAAVGYLPIARVDATLYPFGIEIIKVSISLQADAAYSMVFEEWSGDPIVAQGDIETVTTGAGDSYAEDAVITNSTVDAGDYIMLDLPTTDVPWVQVQVVFYALDGN